MKVLKFNLRGGQELAMHQEQVNRFLFDSEAIKLDLNTIPAWQVDLMRAYGCPDLLADQEDMKASSTLVRKSSCEEKTIMRSVTAKRRT